MVLSERQSESVRFVRVERHVPGLKVLQRVKRLLLANLRDDRWNGRGWGHRQ